MKAAKYAMATMVAISYSCEMNLSAFLFVLAECNKHGKKGLVSVLETKYLNVIKLLRMSSVRRNKSALLHVTLMQG